MAPAANWHGTRADRVSITNLFFSENASLPPGDHARFISRIERATRVHGPTHNAHRTAPLSLHAHRHLTPPQPHQRRSPLRSSRPSPAVTTLSPPAVSTPSSSPPPPSGGPECCLLHTLPPPRELHLQIHGFAPPPNSSSRRLLRPGLLHELQPGRLPSPNPHCFTRG